MQTAPVLLVLAASVAARQAIVTQLRPDGYVLLSISNLDDAKDAIENNDVALVAVDLTGSWQQGLAWCKELRASRVPSSMPLLMIVDGTTIEDVEGVATTDERLGTPFTWMQLRTKVHVLLRHLMYTRRPHHFVVTEQQGVEDVIDVGELRIDIARRWVVCRGQPIELTARLFDLLAYFARRPGVLLSNERILADVWGYVPSTAARSLHVHIRWLREKLELDPAKPAIILTVARQGYRFADVTTCSDAPSR